MKTTMKILKGLASIGIALFQAPMVFVHEILHVIFAAMFGIRSYVVSITFFNMGLNVGMGFTKSVTSKAQRFFITYCIYLIPAFGIAAPFLFKYGFLILIYIILNAFYFDEGRIHTNGLVFPSEQDEIFYKEGNPME